MQQVQRPTSTPLPFITTSDRHPQIEAVLEEYRRAQHHFLASESLHHQTDACWRLAFSACFDPRCNQFAEMIGCPVTLERFSAPGGVQKLGQNQMQRSRILRMMNGQERPTIMFICVHASASDPQSGCAAYKNDVRKALEEARDLVERRNACREHEGSVVYIRVLINTDTDSLTLYGPEKSLDTNSLVYADSSDTMSESLHAKLQDIFPPDWPPLAEFSQWTRRSFYSTLTNCLMANVRHAWDIKAAGRTAFDYKNQARFLVLGRCLPFFGRNTGFLMDDMGPEANLNNLAFLLPIAAANIVWDVVNKRASSDWIVPILLTSAYDNTHVYREAAEAYVLRMRDAGTDCPVGLRAGLHARQKQIAEAVFERLWKKASMPLQLSEKLSREIEQIADRIQFCVTVNNPTTGRLDLVR